jgi:hypothetical protein
MTALEALTHCPLLYSSPALTYINHVKLLITFEGHHAVISINILMNKMAK